MEENNKYVVSFSDSVQIGIELWKPIIRTMIVSDSTTISEVRDFFEKFLKHEDNMNVTISRAYEPPRKIEEF